MACASQASIMLSAANSYCRVASSSSSSLPCSNLFLDTRKRPTSLNLFRIRASAEESDCNAEECAPEKEVGKVSVEWLAAERTKVVGTFPPRRTRGWTGYVEKDTAGQTNIYSVEPAVYVAESAISSGTSGSSADGAEKTLAIYGGLALAFVAAASSILLQVGKNPPQMQTLEYSGPSLSYYISKFTPPETIKATVPAENETSVSVQTEGNNAPEVSEVQAAEYGNLPDASTLSSNVS